MSDPLRAIRVLSDGRPGHENQSIGLAQALARRTGAVVETTRITGAGYFKRYQRAIAATTRETRPQIVIGAGHATHLPLYFASQYFRAKSVVIMNPTWPMQWFDLGLVPAHDSKNNHRDPRIVFTRGALNRIPEQIPAKAARGVVLIGGASKHHGWQEDALFNAVKSVIAARPELAWTVGDSRRTPPDFLPRLQASGLGAQLVPHQKTEPDWVPAQLLAAEEAWVTEDSISMVHEAVTAGARTGILPTPLRREHGRVLNAVRGLVQDGYAATFADWQKNGGKLSPPRPLHETARCADIILERFFPRLRP